MSDPNLAAAPQAGTGESAAPSAALPTRASLRKAAGLRAAQAAATAPQVDLLAATAAPATAPTSVPSPSMAPKSARAAATAAPVVTRTLRSRWRDVRSTVIVALVVPGIFGTMALPAYAFESTPEVAAAAAEQTGAQSLIVNDWTAETVSRDSYTATTPEELAASKAALAAAAAQAAAAAAAAKNSNSSRSSSSAEAYTGPAGAWVRPVSGSISSPYGPRGLICNSAGCSNSFHDGIDFSNTCGTPIAAVSAGRVTFVGNGGAYGNRVIVDHGGGIESIYGHLQGGSYRVSVGDTVAPGTIVASVGATGVVTGCHLDLKISVNGSFTNPVPFLASRGLRL